MAEKRERLRVVILGAGVSASCGIPVAKDILRQSMINLAKEDSGAADDVNRLLSYLYPDFEKGYRNYPNIEDFLNLMEMARAFNSEEFIESNLWPSAKIEAIKKTILSAVTDYIWKFFVTPQPDCPSLDRFVKNHVPTGNVIITFNWDLTLESAFARFRDKVPIAYQYSKASRGEGITLLKPHGSINWFEKKSIIQSGVQHTHELDGKVSLVDFVSLLFSRDLIKATPLIVPPLSNKEFADYSVLQETWGSVYRALSSATVLTVLGYSLPREDQFARFVIRRALRNNIKRAEKANWPPLEMIVVNPDEAVEGTFARLVGRNTVNFKFHRAYFEDFVETLPF